MEKQIPFGLLESLDLLREKDTSYAALQLQKMKPRFQ